MAKMIASKRSNAVGGGRGPRRGAGWVRKNIVMNQRKLDAARRALGVETETEAIDQALEARAEVFAFLNQALPFTFLSAIVMQELAAGACSRLLPAPSSRAFASLRLSPDRRWPPQAVVLG